ncbi:MAG: (d)CMP kinase [Methyloligellaceae bacterium]
MIIAIDGPAASGKGTIARRIAENYGFHYLDTGLLYRAVAFELIRNGENVEDTEAAERIAGRLSSDILDDPGLRDPGVGEAASIVASMASVRNLLLNYQQEFSRQPPGAVLDGRDIATVVCPGADVKLFITATLEERARRRHLQLAQSNPDLTYPQVFELLEKRDLRDTSRAIAPLEKSGDAHLLETTNLSIEAVYKAAVEIIDAAFPIQNDS